MNMIMTMIMSMVRGNRNNMDFWDIRDNRSKSDKSTSLRLSGRDSSNAAGTKELAARRIRGYISGSFLM